jgi:hypothetical protein
MTLPPVATNPLPSPITIDSGMELPAGSRPWAVRMSTFMATTLVAASRVPEAASAGVSPSDRNQVLLAASQVQRGWAAEDMARAISAASLPAVAAVAVAGVGA